MIDDDSYSPYGGSWNGRDDWTRDGITLNKEGQASTATGFRPNYSTTDLLQQRNADYYGNHNMDDAGARSLMHDLRTQQIREDLAAAPQGSTDRIYLQRQLDQGVPIDGRLQVGPGALRNADLLAQHGGFQLTNQQRGFLGAGDPQADPGMWSHGLPGGGRLASGSQLGMGGSTGTFQMNEVLGQQRQEMQAQRPQVSRLSDSPYSNSYLPSNQDVFSAPERGGGNFRPYGMGENGQMDPALTRPSSTAYAHDDNIGPRPDGIHGGYWFNHDANPAVARIGTPHYPQQQAPQYPPLTPRTPQYDSSPEGTTPHVGIHGYLTEPGIYGTPRLDNGSGLQSPDNPAPPLEAGNMYGGAHTWGLKPGEKFPGYTLPVGAPPDSPNSPNAMSNGVGINALGPLSGYSGMGAMQSKPPTMGLPGLGQMSSVPQPQQPAPPYVPPQQPSNADAAPGQRQDFYGPDRDRLSVPSPFSPASTLGGSPNGILAPQPDANQMPQEPSLEDKVRQTSQQNPNGFQGPYGSQWEREALKGEQDSYNQAGQRGQIGSGKPIWQGPDSSGDTMTVSDGSQTSNQMAAFLQLIKPALMARIQQSLPPQPAPSYGGNLNQAQPKPNAGADASFFGQDRSEQQRDPYAAWVASRSPQQMPSPVAATPQTPQGDWLSQLMQTLQGQRR